MKGKVCRTLIIIQSKEEWNTDAQRMRRLAIKLNISVLGNSEDQINKTYSKMRINAEAEIQRINIGEFFLVSG